MKSMKWVVFLTMVQLGAAENFSQISAEKTISIPAQTGAEIAAEIKRDDAYKSISDNLKKAQKSEKNLRKASKELGKKRDKQLDSLKKLLDKHDSHGTSGSKKCCSCDKKKKD